MSTMTTGRSRASLALATALSLIAANVAIETTPASAAASPVFATVSDHDPFSSDANKVGSWCGDLGGTKVSPGGSSYVLPAGTYSKVIVKAGSGEFANTIFAAPPLAGQTVWADTNGNLAYDPGGRGGDKGISHVILCNGVPETPETTDLTVDKVWQYLGERPDGFELGNEEAGELIVTVADVRTDQAWGQPEQGLAVGSEAKVLEGAVPDPKDPEGYTCTITGAPTFSINKADPVTESAPFPLEKTSNTVVVTNEVTCKKTITEPDMGSVEAVKEWTVTGLDPKTADGFTAGTPGTLSFNGVSKPWTNNTTAYDVGTEVEVKEAGNGTPPTATGYKCTIDTAATTYTVGETTDTTPPTVTVTANTTVKVTVTNKANCTKDIPPPPATTTLMVTKVWAYVGTPADYPTLGASSAGALNVTVGGTATGQAWGATKADLKVGDKAAVSEGPVPAPTAYTGYACSITGSPEYAVNGGGFTTTAASFPLSPSANTVTVRNTVTCVADSTVGGTEDDNTTDDSDTADDEQVVAGSEDELAATGANNTGPVGLALLLILSGAAFVTARRLALK